MSSFTYPKISVPATRLIVADLAHDRLDGQVAACVLQGLVNRDRGEKIYVLNTHCADCRGAVQMAPQWLEEGLFADLPTEQLTLDDGPNPGFATLLARFRDVVQGIIIYDPRLEGATIEAATTIAGQTGGVVVSPRMADELTAWQLPVLYDLRDEQFADNVGVLHYLLEHWFATANRDVAFTWSHMTTDEKSWGAANKDYVVAHRLFTFYLDIFDEAERTHYAEVLQRYPPGTPVMGWTDERVADRLLAGQGYFMVPYIAVENLTVQCAFPSVCGTPITPQAAPLDPEAVYLAFFVADGDNLEHALTYEPNVIRHSAEFGQMPLTWVLNPALPDLAPRVFAWYQKRMSAAGQEMIGMLGDGSPLSDRYTGFTAYGAMLRHYLAQSGFLGMKQMSEGELTALQVQPYVLNSGYSCSDERGIGPYEYHLAGETFHIGTIVPGTGRDFANVERIRQVIREAPSGPLFLAVFGGVASFDAPQKIAGFVRELQEDAAGRHPIFLRMSDLAATYRAWHGLPIMP